MSNDFHPIADIFPLLDAAAFEQLVRDVKANGVHEPIWRHRDGRIIDGRNRWRASQVAGVECPSRVFAGGDEDLLAFVISANVNRRHLRASQRAMIAAKLTTVPQGGDRRSACWPLRRRRSRKSTRPIPRRHLPASPVASWKSAPTSCRRTPPTRRRTTPTMR